MKEEESRNTREEVVLADPWRDALEHKVAGCGKVQDARVWHECLGIIDGLIKHQKKHLSERLTMRELEEKMEMRGRLCSEVIQKEKRG